MACLTHVMAEERLKGLGAIGYPILVLTGDEDFVWIFLIHLLRRLTSATKQVLRQPVSSLYLSSTLGGELIVYPGGGHALRMQDPAWHNEHHLRIIQKGIQWRRASNNL
jgi:pimeloyl-ACP methyl ester carboxylesterase